MMAALIKKYFKRIPIWEKQYSVTHCTKPVINPGGPHSPHHHKARRARWATPVSTTLGAVATRKASRKRQSRYWWFSRIVANCTRWKFHRRLRICKAIFGFCIFRWVDRLVWFVVISCRLCTSDTSFTRKMRTAHNRKFGRVPRLTICRAFFETWLEYFKIQTHM